MSEQRDQRNPEEIEADIAQHRERLDESLEELEERFSPQQLFNKTFEYVRHGGANEFAANLGETLKQNPTPFLITGVGLGWLMWSANSRSHSRGTSSNSSIEGHYPSPSAGTVGGDGSQGRGRTGAAKEKAQHLSGSVKDRARGMSDGVRERTSRAKAGSRNAMHSASSRAQSAGQQTTHFIQEHPVVAGALGIAIGAAIGSLLPSTRTEDERMGAMRDKVVDRAAEEGTRYADEARAKVHEKAERAEKQGSAATGRGGSDEGPTSSSAIPPSSTTPGSAASASESNTARQPGVNSDDSR